MSINLKDIERELTNREHELMEALKDVAYKDSESVKQALHRVREAITHIQKAQQ